MKRAFALVVVLAACGVEQTDLDTSNAVQAVVVDVPLDAVPIDPAALLACFDLPEEGAGAWIAERLVYTRGCFQSWAIRVTITDCQIGDRVVSGEVLIAGDAMARVPRTGLFIRLQAATAALVDVAAWLEGESLPRRLDLGIEGDGLALAACGTPVAGGLHAELGLSLDHPALGVLGVEGAAEVTLADGLLGADYRFAVAAVPAEGPAIDGELTGTGIVRRAGDLCPEAGEVRFLGSIGDVASEVLLSYLGDGAVLITLPDGELVGPVTLPRCGS